VISAQRACPVRPPALLVLQAQVATQVRVYFIIKNEFILFKQNTIQNTISLNSFFAS